MEKNLIQRVCPHWFRDVPALDDPLLFETKDRERCRICNYERWHINAITPHPSRDKQSVLEMIQQPGAEFVVEQWLDEDAEQIETPP